MRVSKHHGLGNDFLVRIDGEVDARLAVALCDRRRGIGADGLIGYLDGRMTLINADGSPAEMSGNGIRCLAQAIARHRGVDALDEVIDTDAGPKRVVLTTNGADDREVEVSVDMGEARIVSLDDTRADVDMGNPHRIVLVDDVDAVDLLALGRQQPEINLEIIEPDGDGGLKLRVHERGAGITEACGSGACAAAVVASKWGLVDTDEVVVHMPGGAVRVRLGDHAVTLVGPAVHIADVDVAWR